MATKKVSALPAVSSLSGSDVFPVNATSVSSRITLSDLITLLGFQPSNATLSAIAVNGSSTVGLQFLIVGTPTANSFPKVGTGGNVTLRTAAQLLTDINAQTHHTNLDIWSGLQATSVGSAVITFPAASITGVRYLQFNGDVDQTITALTAAELAASLGGTVSIPRIVSAASPATPLVINAAVTDLYNITALTTDPLAFSLPTGASNGQLLRLRIKDNGVQRALNWSSGFKGTMPANTTVGEVRYMGFEYNSANAYWNQLWTQSLSFT